MRLDQLETIRVETGFTFGQECYLDPARAEEFLSQVNSNSPNRFTRRDFQHLPKQFTLESSKGTHLCAVRPNSFNYTVLGAVDDDQFKEVSAELFRAFSNLFAVSDVRRIGKIFDFPFPKSLSNDSLIGILTIEEPVQVSNLHLVFREQGKNINIHFLPEGKRVVEITNRGIKLEPEPIIRCDINNIDVNSRLDVNRTLSEVYGFADSYVQGKFVRFLKRYFGAES